MVRIYLFLFLLVLYWPVVAQEAKNDDTNYTYTVMDIFLEPRDGMKGLKIRWLNYLKEAKRQGRLDKTRYAEHVFEVLVTKDGSLLERNNAVKDQVLFDFLRKQKKWSPGIQSGCPICYLLKLKVPKELFDRVGIEELTDREDLVKQEPL